MHYLLRLAVVLPLLLLAPGGGARAAEPDPHLFESTWARMDRPVAAGATGRTWLWGPEARTLAIAEPYEGSPGGQRTVQYFDKARMEVNDPAGDAGSVWYVTTGLLATELITGDRQTGPQSYVFHGPSNIPVAGDIADVFSPTYASFQGVLHADPLPVEDSEGALTVIIQAIDRDGTVTSEESWAGYRVTTAHHDEVTNHTIAEPFWEFMNASGTISIDGQLTSGRFFENPYFATGRPITEAYWANVLVGGEATDVLIQCFERRCLTYTPGNPEGWQVEAGNVGLHYYLWRYGEAPEATDLPASIYLYVAGDAGASGVLFGCLDSLVPVNIDVSGSTTEQITQALTALFAYEGDANPGSGLDNALEASTLSVESVALDGDHADVAVSGEALLGGTCDGPRFEKQITRTILQFPGVETADVTLNSQPLEEFLALGP